MRRFFYLLCLLLIPGGCAYLTDTANQDVTLLTPGAKNAKCYVYVERVKYKFNPPETVNIFNSKEDLEIDCLAPGNRRKKISVPATIAKSTTGNVVTGVVPGAAWDYLSGAMFRYPDIIEVDFTGVPVTPEALPAQNNPDIVQPEAYYLEEFSPSRPRMNDDRYIPPPELRRRETSSPVFEGGGYAIESRDTLKDKGDLTAPEPLYPGQ